MSLTSGCTQMKVLETDAIPCELTQIIKLSKDDSFKTKQDVVIYNHIPYQEFCK